MKKQGQSTGYYNEYIPQSLYQSESQTHSSWAGTSKYQGSYGQAGQRSNSNHCS